MVLYPVMTEHLWRLIGILHPDSQGSCATLGYEAKRRWRKDRPRVTAQIERAP